MQITEQQEGSTLILKLDGRLDHEGAEAFQKSASRKISWGCKAIIVDFGGTNFVASMGIRALIPIAQQIAQGGGRFAVAGLNEQVLKLFETAGLSKIFSIYPSVQDALADGNWPK